MINLIEFLKKSIGEPQYTIGLGMIFYRTDVRLKFMRQSCIYKVIYYSKLEIVIKISRNSETLNGPTHSTIPNQPESKIRFHKKSPLHDFIRQTLIYYLVRHLASYCFCFLWVSVVKSSFILTVIQVVPRKGSLFLILCNGPPKYYEASY